MTKITLPPPLPPLSMKALQTVQDIELYAAGALRGCGEEYEFNFEKALRILRTCVVESLEVQMTFYSSLRTYNPKWILEITAKTISATVGLVGLRGGDSYEDFEKELKQTVLEHLEAQARVKQIAKGKNVSVKRPASLGTQIDKLREECRLTVEDLAEGINLAARSVYRHLSGEAIPRQRQVAAYEAFFSKRLSKTVRLETSSKRQPNVRR